MQASAPIYTGTGPHIGASQRRRAIIATVIGNGLEWFDFTVYSFFAVIIAKLYGQYKLLKKLSLSFRMNVET